MRFMNEMDVEDARARYAQHPILGPATTSLYNLMDWTNRHSDGWAYWPLPVRAAAKLIGLIEGDGTSRYRDRDRPDVTVEAYWEALRPIKAFRKKHDADFEILELGNPEPDPVYAGPHADISIVETHYDHGRRYPAVNVKIHQIRGDMERLLPLDLGEVQEAGEKEFHPVRSDEGFTFDWIDAHVPEEQQSSWWDSACIDGFEQARELATETFGAGVKTYSAGRSGGWLIVDGLTEDIEQWDQALVDKWVEFARQVRVIADDVPRNYLWLLNANVYEPWQEAQEQAETEYVLTIRTTNPDLKDRVVRAFEQVGLDLSNAGALHKLSAELMKAGELLWGTEYDPDDDDDEVRVAIVTCKHCGRVIVQEQGCWVDPKATGDDSVWRETCDAHDTRSAEHEPDGEENQ